MAFWSTQKVKAQQQILQDLIDPYDADRVQQGAYELSLSDQALTTPFGSPQVDAIVDGVLMIEPGQFGVMYTAETVHIPADVLAFISIKASVKFHGLVNISGFHVDPGYHARLKFSFYNAGTETIPLEVGKPAFLIWFTDLDQTTEDPYDVPHQHVNQSGVTGQDRVRMRKTVPSPPALDARLKILEDRWRILVALTKYAVVPMMIALVAGIVLWLLATIVPTHDRHSPGRSETICARGAPTPSPSPGLAEAVASPAQPLVQDSPITSSETVAPSATVSHSEAPRP